MEMWLCLLCGSSCDVIEVDNGGKEEIWGAWQHVPFIEKVSSCCESEYAPWNPPIKFDMRRIYNEPNEAIIEDRLGLINHLVALHDEKIQPVDPLHGICKELTTFTGCNAWYYHMEIFLEDWINYSGYPVYPIPRPRRWAEPNLWWAHQGLLRRSACLHIAYKLMEVYSE